MSTNFYRDESGKVVERKEPCRSCGKAAVRSRMSYVGDEWYCDRHGEPYVPAPLPEFRTARDAVKNRRPPSAYAKLKYATEDQWYRWRKELEDRRDSDDVQPATKSAPVSNGLVDEPPHVREFKQQWPSMVDMELKPEEIDHQMFTQHGVKAFHVPAPHETMQSMPTILGQDDLGQEVRDGDWVCVEGWVVAGVKSCIGVDTLTGHRANNGQRFIFVASESRLLSRDDGYEEKTGRVWFGKFTNKYDVIPSLVRESKKENIIVRRCYTKGE